MWEKDIAHIGWNGYFSITEKVSSNSLSVFGCDLECLSNGDFLFAENFAQNDWDGYFSIMKKTSLHVFSELDSTEFSND